MTPFSNIIVFTNLRTKTMTIEFNAISVNNIIVDSLICSIHDEDLISMFYTANSGLRIEETHFDD